LFSAGSALPRLKMLQVRNNAPGLAADRVKRSLFWHLVMNRYSLAIPRRRFLGSAATAAAGLLAPGVSTGRAQIDTSIYLAVVYDEPGRWIAPDFVGLSYESAILAAADYFTPDNASLLGFIRSLGPNGVIRIGGNTSERTVWRPDAKPTAWNSFVITPVSIDRLAAVLRMLGWKLIYGLNLAHGSPEEAAEEAAYVSTAVGSNLLAFQIGNEPDGFGRWVAVRPKPYDAPAFLAEWYRFHQAIRARVPEARFAGPDVAGETDWVAALAAERPTGLVLLTHHYYADGPAGAPHVTLAKLLHSGDRLAPLLEKLAHDACIYSLPYRIVETNSVYDEGQPGVSDTLGAALWGLELMFEAAAAGAAGVNFHTGGHNLRPGTEKAYTPIARSGGHYRAAPLYYAMLAFTRACRGALLPARLASDSNDCKAFAVRTPEGGLQVCLINKDFSHGARVTIDAGWTFGASSVMRLAGPAIGATSGVMLSGASVDEFGTWMPRTRERSHIPAAREITVDLPAASAALVAMHA
jgi:hypothetical protein